MSSKIQMLTDIDQSETETSQASELVIPFFSSSSASQSASMPHSSSSSSGCSLAYFSLHRAQMSSISSCQPSLGPRDSSGTSTWPHVPLELVVRGLRRGEQGGEQLPLGVDGPLREHGGLDGVVVL